MTETEMLVIEQSVHIDAKPEKIWPFWVDPDLLRRWLGQVRAVDARSGGQFQVEVREKHVMSGEFLELVPNERLVFSFGWEGNEPGTPLAPGSTRVEVTFEPDGDGTRVVLRHSDMPATHASDHKAGWQHFLGKLGAVAA